MTPTITPERRIPLGKKVRRHLKRGKLGLESKVIKFQTKLEAKKFRIKRAVLNNQLEWQLNRIEREGGKRKEEIRRAHQQAGEFLERAPQLLAEAKARRERLPRLAAEKGEQVVEGTRLVGMAAGKIGWEVGSLIWNLSFASGRLMRKGIKSFAERQRQRREE